MVSDPIQGECTEGRTEGSLLSTGPEDFVEIVDRFETRLLRYVSQVLKPDHQAAEDVVQETFLRLHRQIEAKGHSSIRNMKTWLFHVAHNLALDAIRKRSRDRKFWDRIFQNGTRNENQATQQDGEIGDLVHREACEQAVAELQKLPEVEREVLVLRIMEGLTLREISEVTGLKTGNVDYRVNKGLREITGRLKTAGVI